MSDEGFREIQLNGKQLIFLFMAVTVVLVVTFLFGVLDGPRRARGRGGDRDCQRRGCAGSGRSRRRQTTPPHRRRRPAAPRPRRPPAPATEELSYAERLLRDTPAEENLKSSAASEAAAAPAPVVQEPVAEKAPAPAASALRQEPPRRASGAQGQRARTCRARTTAVQPTSVPAPAAAAQASDPSGPGFAVQVAAYRDRQDADTLAKQLAAKGYPAFVMDPVKGTSDGSVPRASRQVQDAEGRRGDRGAAPDRGAAHERLDRPVTSCMKPLRLLLVEDSENDATLLIEYLRQGGYEPDYTRVDNEKALTAALDQHDWDLVIADYTMPGFSGTSALAMVRDRGLEVPFIFVSGTIGEEIAVDAMKNGADDYIIKNNLNRLIPAINRELRDAEVRRERSKAEERIRHLAYYDSLTDLPNRTLFQNRLEMAVANALRTRNPLSVLIMDLDGFKEINDTMGHLMGDAVLREIGHRLQLELRESDTVARLGGDEFAVMLPGVGQTGAELAARKLIAAVQEPLTIEGLNLDVHGSVGIAIAPEHGTEAEVLVQRADVAMYVAKEDRSGCVVYAPELDRHSPERLALMGDFRHAISRDELRVVYQPKINLKTRADFRRRGAGALAASAARVHSARSVHPDGRADGSRSPAHVVDARARACSSAWSGSVWATT